MAKKKKAAAKKEALTKEPTLKDKKAILNDIVKRFRKDNPDATLGFATEPEIKAAIAYEKMSTGVQQLDDSLGGGIPRGKFTLFSGKSGAGKTTLALQTIGIDHQSDPDSIWAWCDAENSFDDKWAATLGVDLERLVYIDTDIMEDILQRVVDLSKTGMLKGAVIDSIGVLLPRAEVEAPSTKPGVEAKARTLRQENVAVLNRKIGQFFRMCTPVIGKTNTAMILISHVYVDIGYQGHGEKLITKGGNATAHFAHVRCLFLRRFIQDLVTEVVMPDGRKAKVTSGFETAIKIDKTRQSGTEGYEVFVPFTKGIGFDSKKCTIIAAFSHNVIEQRGAWCYWTGFPDGKIQGKAKANEYITNNPSVYSQLLNDVIAYTSQIDTPEDANENSDQEEDLSGTSITEL